MAKYELTSEDIAALTAAFDRLCEAVNSVSDTLSSNMRRVSEILDSEPEPEPGEGEGEADA